jgi:hypothetical protein
MHTIRQWRIGTMLWCDGCLMVGHRIPATTRSLNPEYAKYAFCEECASKYNAILLDKERDRHAQKGVKQAVWSSVNYPSRLRGDGMFKIKYGGKHYTGCVCDICGALNGNHRQMCVCPYCGGKEGGHTRECHCPQCLGQGGRHSPDCECPVCHRLG